MKAIILAAILHVMPGPSPAWNETKDVFRDRMGMIAEAIAKAAPNRYYALGAVTVFYWEARFSPRLHSGERRGDRGNAICLGQHHRNGRSEDEWEGLAGVTPEATLKCAQATVDALMAADRRCRARHGASSDLTAGFTLYGTGRTCRPEQTKYPKNFRGRGKMHAALRRRFGASGPGS